MAKARSFKDLGLFLGVVTASSLVGCGPPSVDELTDDLMQAVMAERESLVGDLRVSYEVLLQLRDQATEVGCPVVTEEQLARAREHDRQEGNFLHGLRDDLDLSVDACDRTLLALSHDIDCLVMDADPVVSSEELPRAGFRAAAAQLLAETSDANRIVAGRERILGRVRAELGSEVARWGSSIESLTERATGFVESKGRRDERVADLLRQVGS